MEGIASLFIPPGDSKDRISKRLDRTDLSTKLLLGARAVTVVLVRTRGLWGSLWGCARTGQTPDLTCSVLEALGWLLRWTVLFPPKAKCPSAYRDAKPWQSANRVAGGV